MSRLPVCGSALHLPQRLKDMRGLKFIMKINNYIFSALVLLSRERHMAKCCSLNVNCLLQAWVLDVWSPGCSGIWKVVAGFGRWQKAQEMCQAGGGRSQVSSSPSSCRDETLAGSHLGEGGVYFSLQVMVHLEGIWGRNLNRTQHPAQV